MANSAMYMTEPRRMISSKDVSGKKIVFQSIE
jgi:hypothetical protein